MAIDYNFIQQQESFRTTAYTLKDKDGKKASGVTVGTGIDLGYQSATGLLKAGVPKHIVNKLRPYMGLQGSPAKSRLAKRPLKLSTREAKTLDRMVMTRDLGRLERQFNKASKIKFADLPDEVQTVIFSVGHQYGSLPIGTPNFWRQITTGNFDQALGNLNAFGDAHQPRRSREAKLFEQGMFNAALEDIVVPAQPKPRTKAPSGWPLPPSPPGAAKFVSGVELEIEDLLGNEPPAGWPKP